MLILSNIGKLVELESLERFKVGAFFLCVANFNGLV